MNADVRDDGAPDKELADQPWVIGETRRVRADEPFTLPAGARQMTFTGVLKTDDGGGVVMPLVWINDAAAVAEALTDEKADELADLLIHSHDLEVAIQRCDLAAGALAQDQIELAMTYWEAAIIAYGRCFGRGQSAIKRRSRHSLKLEDVEALGLRAEHDEFQAHRDRNVGHRGQHDWLAARVVLFRHPTTGAAVALTPYTFHRHPDGPTLLRFRKLAATLHKEIEHRTTALADELGEIHGIDVSDPADGDSPQAD